jgi:PAS domain S-box-containing protein
VTLFKDFRIRMRLSILLGSCFIYAVAFGPIYSKTGDVVTALTLVPVSLSAWVFGVRGAVIAALLFVPVNILLLEFAGASGFAIIGQRWPGVIGSAAVGLIIGMLSDAHIKLKERTRELASQGEKLQCEIEERKRMQAELARSNERLGHEYEELKKAEGALRRLGTAIEQAAEAICVTDADWVVQYVNPAFEKMTGYAGEEIVGQPAGILKSNKHDDDFYHKVWETLARGDAWSGRIVNRKKDGTLYHAEAMASPVRDKSGVILNYVNIHRDIGNEIRLERELLQARKMEAIGTLAGGIAHEFNNILGVIVGYTELALNKSLEIPGLRHDLTRVKDAGLRAAELVRQILTYSRRTGQERKPLPIVPTVKEALKLLRSVLPSTIEIRREITLDAERSVVESNSTEIHQILMNLCSNAAHAMQAEGGILDVKLWDAANDPALLSKHPDLKDGAYVCLSVTDTGHGIPSYILERVFDPFFTTKNPGEGTGLGLSVVQGIVSSLGGRILIDSEQDRGTTFHVLFPIMEADTPPAIEETVVLRTGTERVLFVDDDEALADAGKGILESLGYNVTVSTDSIRALEAFRRRPAAFDLVITDMTMPRMTGADLAKEFFRIRPEIPVIILTGFSEKMDAEKARSLGIHGFLMKPIVMEDFAELIRKVLDEKRPERINECASA